MACHTRLLYSYFWLTLERRITPIYIYIQHHWKSFKKPSGYCYYLYSLKKNLECLLWLYFQRAFTSAKVQLQGQRCKEVEVPLTCGEKKVRQKLGPVGLPVVRAFFTHGYGRNSRNCIYSSNKSTGDGLNSVAACWIERSCRGLNRHFSFFGRFSYGRKSTRSRKDIYLG